MKRSQPASGTQKPSGVKGVFLTAPYPLSRVTGIGRFVRDLSRFLESSGISVQVAHPAYGLENPTPSDGGIVLRWKAFPSVELALETVRRQLRARSSFQLVHVQQPHFQSMVAEFVGRVLGKPSVLTVHVRPPVAGGRLRQLSHRFVSDLTFRTATLSVAVSPFVAETFRPHRVRVIENGVDTEHFRPSAEGRRRIRARLGIGNETTFVFAGRWTTTKGLDVLLRAADSGVLDGRSFKLIVLGEPGPDDPDFMERQMNEVSNPSRITVVGSIFEGLPEYLSAGDVFVAPSPFEGMPLSFLEAMAVGLPPLASDIPVHRLLVERSRVGWLFPPGDSPGLATAMATIIDHGIPPIWSEQARGMILKYHDIRSKVKEYVEAYEMIEAGINSKGETA